MNWIYFLFMLAYESIWVVLVPIQVTELIFHRRREQTWLRTRGIMVTFAVFLFGSFIAWFAWTQRARPITFHVAPYQPPTQTILAGLAAIVLLIVAAYVLRSIGRAAVADRCAPAPWIVAMVGLLLGLPWYLLMGTIFSPALRWHVSFWIPIAAGIAWAGLACLLFRHWTASPRWSDLHRWTACFAATLVCMTGGFLGSSSWPRIDLIGKIVLNALAVVGFLLLLRRMRRERIRLP